ncbi:MAG: hypothetical protein FD149_1122 [Rhodospirillaceae bacterium]|nr:MAG: hypothetical protein FD149_1122 [Rhodospirillaceae bacterium]
MGICTGPESLSARHACSIILPAIHRERRRRWAGWPTWRGQSDHLAVARSLFIEARGLFAEVRNHQGQADMLLQLGKLAHHQHQSREAWDFLESARDQFRIIGDLAGEVLIDRHLALLALDEGRNDVALERFERARALAREMGDSSAEAHTLQTLAVLDQRLGRVDRAHEALETALELFLATGDRLGEAATQAELGRLLKGLGDLPAARQAFVQAAHLYLMTGHLEGEAESLLELARLEAADDPVHARRHYDHAARLFKRVGSTDKQTLCTEEGAALADQPDR